MPSLDREMGNREGRETRDTALQGTNIARGPLSCRGHGHVSLIPPSFDSVSAIFLLLELEVPTGFLGDDEKKGLIRN